MGWRTVAALWGAGLSTLLAITRLPDPPILRLEPGSATASEPRWLTLRVINDSKRALLVNGYWRIPLRPRGSMLRVFPSGRDSPDEWRRFSEREAQDRSWRQANPRFHLLGDTDHVLRIGPIEDKCLWIVVVWWHRNYALSLPAFVTVTRRIADTIDESRHGGAPPVMENPGSS